MAARVANNVCHLRLVPMCLSSVRLRQRYLLEYDDASCSGAGLRAYFIETVIAGMIASTRFIHQKCPKQKENSGESPHMDTTFLHLHTELARIDLLIHRRLAAMERSAQEAPAPDTNAPTLHMSMDEALRILQQPFGVTPEVEADEGVDATYDEALERLQVQIARVVADGSEDAISDETPSESRLVHLVGVCGLTRFDLDCFLVALAPAVDLRYERLYGYLQDDLTRRRATSNLMLDLLAPGGPERLLYLERLSENAPLVRKRLLRPVAEPGILQPVLLNQGFAANPSIVAWLLGDFRPDDTLTDLVEYRPGTGVETDDSEESNEGGTSLLNDEQRAVIEGAVTQDAFLIVTGKDRSIQRSAQRYLADFAGSPLLTFDINVAVRVVDIVRADLGLDLRHDLRELVALFLRDAALIRATAAIVGWDAVLVDGAPPPQLLNLLSEYPGPVTIASDDLWRSHAVARTRRFTWLTLPIPDYAQRRELLGTLVEGVESEEEINVAGIAGRYRLTGEQMEDVISTALDRAEQAGRTLRNVDIYASAREHSSPRLASLARKLSLRYDWEDLVLPDDQVERLRELVSMVQGRAQVLDEWGLARKLASSYGVTALFSGSPGTGKTMAAEVIAKVLELDVFKIDLSGMVSKYIGETEKNLEKVFAEAESTSAILFFDEADAIFGKRSEVKDAHDRYANIETSYLLQRMEAYDGVTILSTNLRANLDEAFTRRMQVIVDFPFPDDEQRLRIWQTLFPQQIPCADDVDLTVMARRFKIAGGSIRNVLISAAYFAAADGGELNMRHLMHGTRRELQKLGRLTEEKDFSHDSLR